MASHIFKFMELVNWFSIEKSRLGTPLDDRHVGQLQNAVKIDLDVGAPELAATPNDGRIVGAHDAVKDSGNIPSAKCIVRIHVDQGVYVIYDVLIGHVAWLKDRRKTNIYGKQWVFQIMEKRLPLLPVPDPAGNHWQSSCAL